MAEKIVLELDLGSLWDSSEEGLTVADLIVRHAAERLLSSVGDEVRRSLLDRARRIADEEIRERLAPEIERLLSEPVQQTDTWGAPRGPAKSLREVIFESASAQLSVRRDQRSGSDRTPLEEFLRREVSQVFSKELTEAMAQAKAEVLAAVKDEGAKVLSETIMRMART